MRTNWRSAPVLAAVTLLLWVTPDAFSQPHRPMSKPAPAPPVPVYAADCRTVVEGSQATAFCHNPYPAVDRVRLHIECERWWDIDVDGSPADIAPAGYVEITDRCWKEVRSAWVSHQPQAAP
ncbi:MULTISPECIES: hypothetical protein [unclassified Streptomyces]|uniref:hypothetical protein n=1 Tax=unclassified Streptomyces TaxID=2593676 RepID=UPI0028C3E0F9|nr:MULTISPECIES: hypothetical protein [unclassified Streptomyces]WNO75383.1 hypothetical protein RPQ07_28865 [Streptomyces sp. AM8-1-1]